MLRKQIEEKYPFISVLTYGGKEYVGIVVNQDQAITTILDYASLRSNEDKEFLIESGETWWMESNRLIPITIFLRNDLDKIKYCLMNMNSKDVEVLWGPETSLSNIIQKRIKRRSVQLVRKID